MTASIDHENEPNVATANDRAVQPIQAGAIGARRHVLAFAIFLLLAFVALWPGSLHPGGSLLGLPGDNFQHAWFLWHFATALAHGHNPFVTDLLFYPHDVNLAWSTTDPIAAVLALPLERLAGPAVAYNLSLLLEMALGGFFAYLLCLRICGNFTGAVFGGICYGFGPYLTGQALGHLSLVTSFPIPLYFLTLDSLVRRLSGRWRDGLGLGLALFLTSLAHYNYTVFCLLLTAVTLSLEAAHQGTQLVAKLLRPVLGATLLFAALFSPFFVSMWRIPAARPQPRSLELIEGHSADALGWLIPSWLHLLWGPAVRHWNLELFTAGYEGILYLGPVLFALLLAGVAVGWRTERAWTMRLLVVGLVFWALSLGPRVRVWGTMTNIPGPGWLFYHSPFGRFVSVPARFFVVTALCFAALASMAVTALLGKLSSGAARTAFVAGLSVALALDLLTVPFPVSTSAEASRNPGFGTAVEGCRLPDDVRGTAVATVPELIWPYPVRAMWMQVMDGGRYALVDGYVSYGPDTLWDRFWSVAVLRSLRSVQGGQSAPVDDQAARASLAGANLGAVVVFDFPQREQSATYLERILSVAGERQAACTVFDLSDRNRTHRASVNPLY